MYERVLVVEDDRSVPETVTLLLERAGLRVTAADDGRQAREDVALVVVEPTGGLSVSRCLSDGTE